ncbi:MAG: type I 3-dehydroquinate dehydratase [Erysipelotrichia bacterium]|nr:type I 3-dehydroquinate dehydratase [Erysipelotrichia bacterium]NCC55029.1 type I 3-dehydroquinate dehydratase [Erysipelotrichia bacterium]
MKTVSVKNVVLGEGMPKICIAIMGKTLDDLEKEINDLAGLDYDVIEWRMDYFDAIMDFEKAIEAAKLVYTMLADTPVLATFRTAKEGGEKAIEKTAYVALNKAIIASGKCDLIDVECFIGESEVKEIVDFAHAHHVFVVMSNHDFDKTPSYDEIISRLQLMQERNADICKIAFMPTCKRDVLTLLQATLDMSEKYADRPIITMSMASDGVISRLAGEVFGSCLTFGAVKLASAPGQINVKELKTVLTILHKSR